MSTGMTGGAVRRWLSGVGLVVGLAAAPPARADFTPPSWPIMERDARVAFTNADEAEVQRIARAGSPRIVDKRTDVDVVTHLYQDVDVVYEGKFHQIEKQRMTMHYERELTGWSARGYTWGDVEVVRPGKYPPPPPPPPANEIQELVKDPGLADAHIPADKIEKVVVTGKPKLSWEFDKKPVAVYEVPVKVYVQDSVANPSSFPPVVWKTRCICDVNATLAFSGGIWDLRSAECGEGHGCRLGSSCPDLWKPGAKGKAGGKSVKRK